MPDLGYNSGKNKGEARMDKKKRRNEHIKQYRKKAPEQEEAVKDSVEEETADEASEETEWSAGFTDEELEETMDPFSKGNCFLQIIYLIIILGALIMVILYIIGYF